MLKTAPFILQINTKNQLHHKHFTMISYSDKHLCVLHRRHMVINYFQLSVEKTTQKQILKDKNTAVNIETFRVTEGKSWILFRHFHICASYARHKITSKNT